MYLLHSDSIVWYCAKFGFFFETLISLQFQYEEILSKTSHFNTDKLKKTANFQIKLVNFFVEF